MSKRSSQSFLPTLFPFLSILTCTAGVLSFIIISIGVVSILAPSIIVKSKDMVVTKRKKPVYVECHPDHLVLVQEQKKVDYYVIDDPESEYGLFLKRVQQKADSLYIVFAVYPDGERTFRKAYSMVNNFNERAGKKGPIIDVGYEPFNRSWHLKAE
ncbi:MAG: hypothetical protein GXO77_01145 [Calditrichaeota bacterium]|nr:hypothetical protein [Calditrichota bacterium]